MSIFRRREIDVQPLEASEEIFQDALNVCSPNECLEANPLNAEINRIQEIQLDSIDESCQEWSAELANSREYTANARQIILDGILRYGKEQHGANAQDRRWAEKNFVRSDVANIMAEVRQHAIDHIREDLRDQHGIDSIEETLLGDNTPKLNDLKQGLRRHLASSFDASKSIEQNSPCGTFVYEGVRFPNPYFKLYLREVLARTEIASLIHTDPELSRSVLDPTNIDNLPEEMRALIAQDLKHPRHSVVMQYIKGQTDVSDSYFDYLNKNSLSPESLKISKAIAIGAKALGGCQCPMNGAGLCRQSADAIDSESLPEEITSDISRKKAAKLKVDTALLTSFGVQNSQSDWLTFGSIIRAQPPEYVPMSKSKKQRSQSNANIPSIKSIDQSIEKSVSKEIIPPRTIALSHKSFDAIIKSETNDTDALINKVLETDEFSKYIQKYSEQADLSNYVRSALKLIFCAGNYRTEPALRIMSHMRPIHGLGDGKRLTVWRLSGQGFTGNAGKVGRDTRIYFAVDNSSDTRRIEILRIAHKSDVAKEMRRTRSV